MYPRISVIVPVYNAEPYLRACVESVLTQSYPELELILIDDGSSDGSPAICDAYGADPRVRLVHTENRGVCAARNTGLELAGGAYISFLDADDALLPDALLRMYQLLVRHSCDIAVCTKLSFRPNGSSFRSDFPEPFEKWEGREGIEAALRDHPATYSIWGKLIRREITEGIRFEPGRRINEDSFFFFLCLLREPRVAVQSDPVIHYNLSDNSASRGAFSEKYLDILYFAQRKREIIQKELPEYSALAENVMVKAHMALLKKLSLSADPKARPLERSALRYVRTHRRAFIPALPSDLRLYRYIVFYLYGPRKWILTRKRLLKRRMDR